MYVSIGKNDHFANELFGFDPDLFQNNASKNGFIRKWYEVLFIEETGVRVFLIKIG